MVWGLDADGRRLALVRDIVLPADPAPGAAGPGSADRRRRGPRRRWRRRSVIALIGLLNLDYHPCPNGTVVLPPGQTSYECGGFDGTPWLIVGALLMVGAVLVFWWLRGLRTDHQRHSATGR